jgi:hypothetical protein
VTRVSGGLVERVNVQLGVEDRASEVVEVVSGLAQGDTVLLRNARALPPGTRVSLPGGQARPAPSPPAQARGTAER